MTFVSMFDFSQSYLLADDRVLLRPLELTDAEHLLCFSLEEPDLWKYSLVQANGAENLEKYLQIAVAGRTVQKEYPFIVYDKQEGRYAGSTRFYDIQLGFDTLQLGYTWYGTQFQGTGLNKHCKFLLLSFAFEHMGMERVEFRADNRNERSKAAMKSIGCIEEGVLRGNMPTNEGTRRDSVVLSILKDEWFGHVKENIRKKMNT